MRESKCPVTGYTSMGAVGGVYTNKDWWPNQLNLKILSENSELSNPMSKGFDYAKEFKKLNLKEVKKDLFANLLKTILFFSYYYVFYSSVFTPPKRLSLSLYFTIAFFNSSLLKSGHKTSVK